MSCGVLEVICGPMFSGKSTELLRRLTRAQIAQQKVVAFKHEIDTRYSSKAIAAHDGRSLEALLCPNSMELVALAAGFDVVGIDEAQFFDLELPIVVEALVRRGQRVVVVGLDLDAEGRPFGTMPTLMALADRLTKLDAICMVCGKSATRTYRKSGRASQRDVGVQQYEARCRTCWLSG